MGKGLAECKHRAMDERRTRSTVGLIPAQRQPVQDGALLERPKLARAPGRPSPWRPHPVIALGFVLTLMTFLLNLTPVVVVMLILVTLLGLQTVVAIDRGCLVAEHLGEGPDPEAVARAVADALFAVGALSVDSRAVRHLGHRQLLEGVGASEAQCFDEAVDEVLTPLVSPRYVVPRWVITVRPHNIVGLRIAMGWLGPDSEVWHAVPTVLGTTDARAQAFARAWDQWVGGGPALWTGTRQGMAVLVAAHKPVDGTARAEQDASAR